MKHHLVLSALLVSCCAVPASGGEFDAARHGMVQEVLADVPAMEKVERHSFVPPGLADLAYLNRPLSIGYGQTISQPYIVALMTELMQAKAGDRVHHRCAVPFRISINQRIFIRN